MTIEIWDSITKELIDLIFVGTRTHSLSLLLSGEEYPPDLTLQIISSEGKTHIFPPQMLKHIYLVTIKN